MTWTTTPPTRPGWYWAWMPECSPKVVQVIEMSLDPGRLAVNGQVIGENCLYTHWKGPLTVPLAPQEPAT